MWTSHCEDHWKKNSFNTIIEEKRGRKYLRDAGHREKKKQKLFIKATIPITRETLSDNRHSLADLPIKLKQTETLVRKQEAFFFIKLSYNRINFKSVFMYCYTPQRAYSTLYMLHNYILYAIVAMNTFNSIRFCPLVFRKH